jgi:hypothetical protein
MDVQSLLNEDGDINDDVFNEPPVPGPANLLKLTSDEIHLGLLHTDIKYSAVVPFNPRFKALPRAYPVRPFKLCLPDGFKANPLAFFHLFFPDEIIDILVCNTNLNAEAKEARTGRYGEGRRWKPIDRHELSTWIGLLIYIRLNGNSSIGSYWSTDKHCIHRLMLLMLEYRFEQIKRYFHVSPLTAEPIDWYMKLSPLFEHLRTSFKAFCVPSQNVSVDEIMKAFTGRSAHTVKMKNKPVGEGYKM